MAIDTIIPERTALLFFDMLNGHVKKDDPKTQARYKPILVAATKLLQEARAHKMMVAYAAAHHRPDNLTSSQNMIRDTDGRLNPIVESSPRQYKPNVAGGTWGGAIIDELAPEPQDYMIPKYRWSAFYQTYLDLALRTRKIDTIIIAGGSTDVGIASTIYAARDMDYNLVMVSDACGSPENDNHEQLMRRIFPRMGRVRTADQVVQMLRAGAGK